MFVKFTQQFRGFHPGVTYNLAEGLAKLHIDQGRATELERKPKPTKPLAAKVRGKRDKSNYQSRNVDRVDE